MLVTRRMSVISSSEGSHAPRREGASSRPQVDVAVVTWNTRDLTVEALRRLLDEDAGCDVRLLVRDNGSTDGTAEAIRKLVPEAELDAGDTNLGFAKAMNALIARARAPWFFALNSDAWPDPGALVTLVRTAEAFPAAAAVAPRLERPDGTLEHSTHPFPSLRVAAVTATGAYRLIGAERARRMMLVGAWHHDAPRAVDWAVGAALLMRRAALDDIGGFDERFFMYAEDLEWCWRARRRGWEIRFEPAALVRHVGNASGERRYGSHRTEAYLRNTYRFYRREHGAASTALYRAINVAGSARLWARSVLGRNARRAEVWREQLRAHLSAGRGAG